MIVQSPVFIHFGVSRTRQNDPRRSLDTRHFYVISGTRNAKRRDRNTSRKHTLDDITWPAARKPKHMPAGYSAADYSKDQHFILLHFMMKSGLHCTKVKINDTLEQAECFVWNCVI